MTKCALQFTVIGFSNVDNGKQAHTEQQPSVTRSFDAPSTLKPDYAAARFVKEISGPGSADFSAPWDVLCLPSGNVVVLNYANHSLEIFNYDLQHITTVTLGDTKKKKNCLARIAADSQGRIFASIFQEPSIHVFHEEGRLLYSFKCTEQGNGQSRRPTDVAIDSRDRVYVFDMDSNRVQVVTTEGTYIKTLTQTGSGPNMLKSRLYFISAANGIVSVKDWQGYWYIFNESGHLLKTFDQFPGARDMTTDPWGNMLVTDPTERCIVVLDTEGQVVCRISSKGYDPGQMRSPCGITLTKQGDLLVTDIFRNKLLKFEIPKLGC